MAGNDLVLQGERTWVFCGWRRASPAERWVEHGFLSGWQPARPSEQRVFPAFSFFKIRIRAMRNSCFKLRQIPETVETRGFKRSRELI